MAPKAGERGELSAKDGRPIPNPEPVEAGIFTDRSLAVRFEGGPWIRPTDEEIALYGPVLGTQPVGDVWGECEWFFQCPTSGRVRFTTKKDDTLHSRLGKNDEQKRYRLLFEKDQAPTEPKAFTCILRVSGIKDLVSSSNTEGLPWLERRRESIPAANFPIPADVAPIDIPPTPFAHAYSSKGLATMTDKFPLLEHVNCSYLSTHHHAPTLLELKQHAQALAVLIYEMSGPSTSSAQVNNDGLGDREFPNGEPFDWLNDLSKPYVNVDVEHSIPLTTLMNTYHHDHKTVRTTQICPLSSLPRTREAKDAGRRGLPYMTHEALTQHANECLEILDHEFSAEGGLLAILPDMENTSGRTLSGKTLLGQFILFTQRLVQRVHELEIRAANAADLLSGEKVIPDKMIGLVPGLNGRDGTRPTPVAYPQHKYVLANAGAPAWDELTKMLNIKEKMDRDLHTYNVQQGLSASSQWESGRNMEFRSGLTHIDVITRYTRVWDANSITGTPTPIFIIPGSAVHPGLAATREMESKPHVVQVVKPQYPERLSLLEEKYENKKYEYEDIIMEHRRLKQDNEDHLETIAVQQIMYKDLQAENSYRRAEQQGRGVEDLAKFRNPIAEKEKKVDETQRDLDQKLLATEYALRDAKRLEKAAQGELRKLANWKEVETAKIQAVVEQNESLTAGVRATYAKNAGIDFANDPLASRMWENKYGQWETDEKLTDVTDVVPWPLPVNFQGVRTYLDRSGNHVSQTVINGIPQTQVNAATAAEIAVFEERARGTYVLTVFPGIDHYSPLEDDYTGPNDSDGKDDDDDMADETATYLEYNPPTTKPWDAEIPSNPIKDFDSLDENTLPIRKKRVASIRRRQRGPTETTPPNWASIEFIDIYEVLIAAAMQSIGWEARYNAPEDPTIKSHYEWYKKDSSPLEVLPEDAWLEKLTASAVSVPIITTINPDWSKANFVHIFRAMTDAGWSHFADPHASDGSCICWGREKTPGGDDLVFEDPREWLTRMAEEGDVSGDGWDVATDEQVRTSMTRAGYTLVECLKGDGDEGEVELRWLAIVDGRNGIPAPGEIELTMDTARKFLKELAG